MTQQLELILRQTRAIIAVRASRPRLLHLESDHICRLAVAFAARHCATYAAAESIAEAMRELRSACYDMVVVAPRIEREAGEELSRIIDALPRRPVVAYLSP